MRASLDIPLASRRRNIAARWETCRLTSTAPIAISRILALDILWLRDQLVPFATSASVPVWQQLRAPSLQQLEQPCSDVTWHHGLQLCARQSRAGHDHRWRNPLLRQNARGISLGVNYEVPKVSGLTLSANYYRNRSRNPLSAFPELTPDVESAFPDRVVRDSAGRLIRSTVARSTIFRQARRRTSLGNQFFETGPGRKVGRRVVQAPLAGLWQAASHLAEEAFVAPVRASGSNFRYRIPSN